MKLVFLGGTCGNNVWRPGFIARLVARGVDKATLFDPVVADWNEEAQRREEDTKARATHHLYYLADPKQDGNPQSAYSMVEAALALGDPKRRKNTVVVFDTESMSGHALKAMKQTEKVFRKKFPDAHIFGTPGEAESWLVRQLTPHPVARLFAA